jgi:cytochrome P450
VTRDTELLGRQLYAYDRIWMSWAAANLDPAAFAEPETIDLRRSPNRHIGFGSGIHRCIGANFARLVWETVLTTVLTRLPDYHIDLERSERFGEIGYNNGWAHTPATFTPGPKLGATLG